MADAAADAEELDGGPGISDEVMQVAVDHMYSDIDVEMGGFFVGQIVDGRAEIEAAIPALKATSSLVDLTFDHEVWMEVVNKVDTDYPGKVIVGWFHSHPGHGVFLSGYDKFIHQSFFVEDGMVALVVDPVDGAVGWFPTEGGEIGAGVRSKIDPAPAAVAAAKAKAKAAKRAGQSASISTIVVTGLVAAIIAGAGGYIFGSKQAKSAESARLTSELLKANANIESAQLTINDLLKDANFYTQKVGTVWTIKENDSLRSIAQATLGNAERSDDIQNFSLYDQRRKELFSNKDVVGSRKPDEPFGPKFVGKQILIPRRDLTSPSTTAVPQSTSVPSASSTTTSVPKSTTTTGPPTTPTTAPGGGA